MKTIEKESDRQAHNGYFRVIDYAELQAFKHGFYEGVKFAQRWIPVEEELPDREIPNSSFSDKVLTKNEIENVNIERYDFEFKTFAGKRHGNKVTHWRPITIK